MPPPKPFPSLDEGSLDVPKLKPMETKKIDNFNLDNYIASLKAKDPKIKKKDFDLNSYLSGLGTNNQKQLHQEEPSKSVEYLDDTNLDDTDPSETDFPEEMAEFEKKLERHKKSIRKENSKKVKLPKKQEKKIKQFGTPRSYENLPHYVPLMQDIENLSESRKEIEKAVEKASSVSVFDKLFKKSSKNVQKKSISIDKSLPDVEKINVLIEQGREALVRFDLKTSREAYLKAMEIYNKLPAVDKKLFYEELNQLYRDRKSAESLGR